MKVVHSWLKEYVGDDLPDVEKVADLLTFHSFEVEGIEEVAGEQVIDVDVLPNRSSDCLCHRGMAKEISALLDTDLAKDPLTQAVELTKTDKISIEIEDSADCPRFTAALVNNIEVQESPDWLRQRLEAIGVRSINNVVDATNYVMFALGEPLHAYDADLFPQVDGEWKFIVRKAREGEEVSLLAEGGKDEERVVVCKGTELLIVDGSSDTPIGLAGVKGGAFAGVKKDTKNIIIEAAHFNPTLTRKTARRLGIVIDASKRFENEPSRELPPYAQMEVVKLIIEIAGGTFEGYKDEYLEEQTSVPVTVRTKRVNQLLGLELTTKAIQLLLQRIGCNVEDVQADALVCVGPFERTDLRIEEDFIEEVGRLYGLDNIVSVVPDVQPLRELNKRHFYSDKIRHILIENGFSEVITSSFHKKGKIQLRNALASDKSYARGNLRKNIDAVLDKNFTHTDLLGTTDVRVFEIGTVFVPGENSIKEHFSIAVGVRTKGNGYSDADDKVLAASISEIEAAVGGPVEWNIEKGVAEANLTELLTTLEDPTEYEVFEKSPDVAYSAPSQYPAIARDIALWVPEDTQVEAVQAALTAAAGDLMVRIDLFDTFTKEGRTSYAFRMVFQSREKTLTDEEINTQMEAINQICKDNSWEVR